MPLDLPNAPQKRFAGTLRQLTGAVVTRNLVGLLAMALATSIIGRLRGLIERFDAIAARVAAGRYAPRQRAASPGKRSGQKPPPPNPLPRKFGWLLPLVPDAAGARSQMQHLFRDPQMARLMTAAPVPMRRVLRPLCRMLRLDLPPELALPAKPRRPRAPRPEKPKPPPPRQLPPEAPEWLRTMPGGKPWSIRRCCGRRGPV